MTPPNVKELCERLRDEAREAARYRWLRDNGRIDRDWFHLHWADAKQKLDDAIDAAIAKGNGGRSDLAATLAVKAAAALEAQAERIAELEAERIAILNGAGAIVGNTAEAAGASIEAAEARAERYRAALAELVGLLEVAAVMPEAIDKRLFIAWDDPELNRARAALKGDE